MGIPGHIDETSWRVFEDVVDKANNRWWLWVFVGPDTVVFLVDPTRSTKVPSRHLGIDVEQGSLKEGRRLLISSDFFTVYQALSNVEGIDPLWCFAHIRRYFIRAGDAHKELRNWATAWTSRIGMLYVAHRAVSESPVGSIEHAGATADFTNALLAIDTVRRAEASDETLHPAAAKVITTLDREWEGLSRHESFPELPLDNNAAERALRNPVVMRKNCYGSGSVWAGELAARVWTITATAERALCNPLTYLCSYLDACAKNSGRPLSGKELEAFFPWAATEDDLINWRAQLTGPAP